METKDTHVMDCNSPKNYLLLVLALTLSLIFAFGATQTLAKDNDKKDGWYGGGYSGPNPAIVTVEQAKNMHDDAKVTLRGKIIQHLGGEDYLFQDATGTIEVEISDRKWQGQNIGPNDLVEIYGEVDKEWATVEIEVKQIRKQ